MANNHKIFWITTAIVFSFILLSFIPMFFHKGTLLHNLEKEVDNISFPASVEKVAIKSDIGDSGGNGQYSTLRVVMAVKTDLDKNALKDTIEKMNLRFPKHYSTNNNVPIFYVTHCNGTEFASSRDFTLKFDELSAVNDYSNFYFIEFVE